MNTEQVVESIYDVNKLIFTFDEVQKVEIFDENIIKLSGDIENQSFSIILVYPHKEVAEKLYKEFTSHIGKLNIRPEDSYHHVIH